MASVANWIAAAIYSTGRQLQNEMGAGKEERRERGGNDDAAFVGLAQTFGHIKKRLSRMSTLKHVQEISRLLINHDQAIR